MQLLYCSVPCQKCIHPLQTNFEHELMLDYGLICTAWLSLHQNKQTMVSGRQKQIILSCVNLHSLPSDLRAQFSALLLNLKCQIALSTSVHLGYSIPVCCSATYLLLSKEKFPLQISRCLLTISSSPSQIFALLGLLNQHCQYIVL